MSPVDDGVRLPRSRKYDGNRKDMPAVVVAGTSQTRLHGREKIPDDTLEESGNFCRNPDERVGGPWCFTRDLNIVWRYCHVPKYSGELKLTLAVTALHATCLSGPLSM